MSEIVGSAPLPTWAEARYGAGMLVFGAVVLAAAISTAPRDAATVLGALRAATGGAAWSTVPALDVVGSKVSFGLTGRFHETDDLATGRFRRVAEYPLFTNGEGADASGRWRLDGSGGVHALDSGEATAIAATERYLVRRGYLRDDAPARRRLLPAAPGTERYARVEVTPPGGRPATLWIRRSDALLERVTLALSPHVEEITFSDYRRAGGLLLPFRIALQHGDDAQSGTAVVSAYRALRTVPAGALARPRTRNDVTFADAAESTTVPARIDPHSGFLLVEAALGSAPPAPFILDTGGHDIVTPVAARRMKLKVTGAGTSYGAGSGTTPTRFAAVPSVALGSARLGPQPFTVLAIDLGTTPDAKGRAVPVAGLLGLEMFERFAVTIRHGSVTFARTSPRAGSCRPIPLHFTDDMPLATANVDGHPGTFGIDTGNNVDPIVFEPFVRANGIPTHTMPATMAGGSSVGGSMSLVHGRVDRLAFGPAIFENVPVSVSSMRTGSLATRSEAGNLGLSLLMRFSAVTFDYRRHRMCAEKIR
jgi:hypothetical protein